MSTQQRKYADTHVVEYAMALAPLVAVVVGVLALQSAGMFEYANVTRLRLSGLFCDDMGLTWFCEDPRRESDRTLSVAYLGYVTFVVSTMAMLAWIAVGSHMSLDSFFSDMKAWFRFLGALALLALILAAGPLLFVKAPYSSIVGWLVPCSAWFAGIFMARTIACCIRVVIQRAR